MAWLDDHPPVRSQFRCPRRANPNGLVVVHTAEAKPDTIGLDGAAEAVANFIRNRTDAGSYHDLVDSDSIINLVRYECEAFHDGTGSNPYSYGVSAATKADEWSTVPTGWRNACVRNMAAAAATYADWLVKRTGIIIPARRVTRSESELGVAGFISHAERDPARRTDPGAAFPWADFLAHFDAFTRPEPPEPEPESEDDLMPMPVLTVPGDTEGRAVFMVLDRANKELIRLVDIKDGAGNVITTAQQRHEAGVKAGLYQPARAVDVFTYDRAAVECQGNGDKAPGA